VVSLSVARGGLDGVSMPELRVVSGTQMRLNGIGLRTFSVLGIHLCAGVVSGAPERQPRCALRSSEKKLLDIRFLRDVDAEDARKAWKESFEQNCKAPCHLDPRDEQRFLAAVPSVHRGDGSTLLFTSKGVHVTLNGRPMGDIADPQFSQLMLATFIGAEPPTPRLKRELLGFRD
jgi:hypothetical protein